MAAAPRVAQAGAAECYALIGKVGPYPVGMTLLVSDKVQIVGGHYFYVSSLKDIPLTVLRQTPNIQLREAGGGTFRLMLRRGAGEVNGGPLTFHVSTGLGGSWTDGRRTFPVVMDMDHSCAAEGPRYAAVTREADAVFEARAQRFLRAAIANDRRTAAKLVSYPLRVNLAHSALRVRNAAELNGNWSRIFTPNYVAKLRAAVPHDMFVHQGMAMVGKGAVWFDAKGAAALNVS